MVKRNTSGLLAYAEKRDIETDLKVNAAIDRMKRSGKTIHFSSVAKESGVSKATLYNHLLLKERIMSLRAVQRTPSSIPKKAENTDLAKQLRMEIQYLKKDKENLILQLLEFEALKEENQRLKDRILSFVK